MARTARLFHDEPICIYVPLLVRPWAMQACHSKASCHLGTARTLRILERFYRWIGMSICTRWCLRNCLKRQARKTPRQTVRWPTITLPLSEGPGIAVRIDYFGPYILLFTDRFRGRADMYAVTAADITPEGTANILINLHIPLWGCPRSILSGNGLRFCSKLSHAVYQLLGVRKTATAPATRTATLG